MRKISVLVIFAVLGFAFSSAVYADSAAGDVRAEIDALKARITQLEAKPASQQAAVPVVPAPAAEIPTPSWPVSGIYTVPDTKDVGKLTGIPALEGTKIRGWIDTNYVVNFNHPARTTVNANQATSIVKGHDISVEGRTFDVHDESFNLSLAEVEIEKVPDVGGVGYKLDIAYGETQDIIVDTIRGSLGPSAAADSVTDFDKTFQHASVSYVAPWGKGVRFDAGKFVTHIGGETIETVKNWNYSHSFFYTYAIPFQDTGVHVSYPWTDKFYTDLYVLNGWNVTIDNNTGKTIGPAIGWTATPWLSVYANYLGGPEQNDTGRNLRHLFDTQVVLGPFYDRWNFMVNYDYGSEQKAINAITANVSNASWWGVTGYARYKINDMFEPSLRVEYFRDAKGMQTGIKQGLVGYTLTWNTKLAASKGSLLLLRPEIRYDRSSDRFFTDDRRFHNNKDQLTVELGVSWLF